jgi:hypothetical protein
MMDNGMVALNMATVYKYGLMELNMKECGQKAKQQEKENLPILPAIHTKENGKMIKHMDMVFASMQKVEQDMKDIGSEICSMAQVLKSILMAIALKVCSRRGRKAEKALITSLMGPSIKENGLMAELRVRDFASGRMEEDIRGHGSITRSMGTGYSHGRMAESTKASTGTTRSTGRGRTHGRMDANIEANGRMIRDMERANIS